MQTRLPLSPLPSGFVRNSNLAQQPSDKDGGNNRPPPFDAHSANFLSHPQRPIALEFSSQDAFTFATPARRLNTAQPTVPSQEIPSPSFANLGAVPGAVAFNTGPFRGNDLMSTPANSRWDVQSSSIPAQNDPPASESERWRLQPHTQPKGCLAQCLTSEIPTAVQTSLDRLQLGRRSKAVGSLGPGSSDHPTTIDDIIPPTPGADTDSWQHGVIVPGTQVGCGPAVLQRDRQETLARGSSHISKLPHTLRTQVLMALYCRASAYPLASKHHELFLTAFNGLQQMVPKHQRTEQSCWKPSTEAQSLGTTIRNMSISARRANHSCKGIRRLLDVSKQTFRHAFVRGSTTPSIIELNHCCDLCPLNVISSLKVLEL